MRIKHWELPIPDNEVGRALMRVLQQSVRHPEVAVPLDTEVGDFIARVDKGMAPVPDLEAFNQISLAVALRSMGAGDPQKADDRYVVADDRWPWNRVAFIEQGLLESTPVALLRKVTDTTLICTLTGNEPTQYGQGLTSTILGAAQPNRLLQWFPQLQEQVSILTLDPAQRLAAYVSLSTYESVDNKSILIPLVKRATIRDNQYWCTCGAHGKSHGAPHRLFSYSVRAYYTSDSPLEKLKKELPDWTFMRLLAPTPERSFQLTQNLWHKAVEAAASKRESGLSQHAILTLQQLKGELEEYQRFFGLEFDMTLPPAVRRRVARRAGRLRIKESIEANS